MRLSIQWLATMTNAPGIKVIRIIARLNVGGPAKHVTWLTSCLQGLGYETLLVAGTVPPGEEDMSYFAIQNGVYPLYLREMSREISLKDIFTVWKLFRLFQRERPAVVHTHTAKAGTVGRLAGLLYRWSTPGAIIGKPRRCKFVHTYHGHIFHSYYGRLKTAVFVTIERLLATLATDCIVVISEQQRTEIQNTFRVGSAKKFKVIPLGLDLSIFKEGPRRRHIFRNELGIADEVVLVGIVGRLTEIKNHEFFLRAVAALKDQITAEHPIVKFVIIGDGSLRDVLKLRAQSLNLNNEVVFIGSRKDPENFYPALDIVALTSRNEGTPLTLIEAMANARPIVATSVGGVVDLLGEVTDHGITYETCKHGISVPPGNVEGFAAAMLQLSQNSELRMQLGHQGREFVERRHTKERLTEDISELYAQLLTDKAAAKTCSAEQGIRGRI